MVVLVYVKNGLNAEIIENLSPFENKIIESLTIQLTYPTSNKCILLTSIYRSNGPIVNVTATQQMDSFIEKFTNLLADLKATNKMSIIFTDSNINLLNLHMPDVSNYLNAILAHGYIQGIAKATRIQNDSCSLIDHILSNLNANNLYAGTLISDVSNHFFTFIIPKLSSSMNQQTHRTVVSRVKLVFKIGIVCFLSWM